MLVKKICRQVNALLRKYQERDPFKLAQAMGIGVSFANMGKGKGACKGFFLYHSRQSHITVNADLPAPLQRVVLAHELGHAVLHRKAARMRTFHDFTLYDTSSELEYEANLFAAELLLDDQVVKDRLTEDTFFFAVAKELGVPAELLDFKFRILKRKGWLINSPIHAPNNFLKEV